MLVFIRACKRDHFKGLDARERICDNESSYLIWLKMGTRTGFLWKSNTLSGFVKVGEFLK
jgi:hypothetical protein